MSNQAYSVSEDLMVGAGVLYFKRDDDNNGWHHLGNVDEFNITNDVEKVDKNSSMNKKRELMASVITSIKPTASLTLTEYNPYNLALGLYGTEGVTKQAGVTLTKEPYTVQSVPGVITLVDPKGNRYMDVRDITIEPSVGLPATFKAMNVGPASAAMSITTTTVTDDTFTDVLGGTLVLNTGTWTGTSDVDVYLTIDTAPTAAGDLDGMVVKVQEGIAGTVQTFNVTSTKLTETFTLASGATIVATVTASDNFTATGTSNPITGMQAKLITSMTTYDPNIDYTVDPQENRAGIVRIKPNSRIKPGDTVLISATVPEKSFVTVNGGAAGDISGSLLFIGDPNIGGMYNIEGWRVKVTPDGDLTGLISSEFGTFTLSIDFLSDYENHPEAPYYRATLIGRANSSQTTAGVYDPKY